jgi:glyoxylase-like metal-dependent hydrolase (beta-lactamase superfamily II)
MIRIISFGHATCLLEASGTRTLVDPWLTQRLDRFWERAPRLPDGLLDILDAGVDRIVLTHHHCDHLHYPSLRLLAERLDPERVEVLYPDGTDFRYTGSGMGHPPIPWALRRLGFTRFHALRKHESVDLGRDGAPGGAAQLRTFPSRVRFPELSLYVSTAHESAMFCADAMLHPETWEYFTATGVRAPQVALVSAHSVVPPNVLTERRLKGRHEDSRAPAATTFDRYVTTINAAVTVPFACAWRVGTLDGDFEWCNRMMYPFTPTQALDRLHLLGRRGGYLGPGAVLEIDRSDVEFGTADGVKPDYDLPTVYAGITLDPQVPIPAFDPQSERVGTQRESTDRLAQRMMDALVGTDLWGRAVQNSDLYAVRIYDDAAGACDFILDPAAGIVRSGGTPALESGGEQPGNYSTITAATVQSLFDGTLLYGSAWGLWTGNNPLLSAIFHQPALFQRHLRTPWPRRPEAISRTDRPRARPPARVDGGCPTGESTFSPNSFRELPMTRMVGLDLYLKSAKHVCCATMGALG